MFIMNAFGIPMAHSLNCPGNSAAGPAGLTSRSICRSAAIKGKANAFSCWFQALGCATAGVAALSLVHHTSISHGGIGMLWTFGIAAAIATLVTFAASQGLGCSARAQPPHRASETRQAKHTGCSCSSAPHPSNELLPLDVNSDSNAAREQLTRCRKDQNETPAPSAPIPHDADASPSTPRAYQCPAPSSSQPTTSRQPTSLPKHHHARPTSPTSPGPLSTAHARPLTTQPATKPTTTTTATQPLKKVSHGSLSRTGASSPVCLLAHAALATTTTTTAASSNSSTRTSTGAPSSGRSHARPAALVDSFSAAAALRRRYMHYRRPGTSKPCIPCASPAVPAPASAPASSTMALPAPEAHTGSSEAAPPSASSFPTPVATAGAATTSSFVYRRRGCSCQSSSSGPSACVCICRAAMPVHIKLPYMEPEQLPPGFLAAVNQALLRRTQGHGEGASDGVCGGGSGGGLMIVGAAVRRGCVELTLDLMERANPSGSTRSTPMRTNLSRHSNTGASASSQRQELEQQYLAEQDDSWLLELPALVMAAIGAPPQSLTAAGAAAGAAAAAVAGGYEAGQQEQQQALAPQSVLVQRGGACWEVRWDSEGSQWRVVTEHQDAEAQDASKDGGGAPQDSEGMQKQQLSRVWQVGRRGDGSSSCGAAGGVAIVEAPMAVHAPVQLVARSSSEEGEAVVAVDAAATVACRASEQSAKKRQQLLQLELLVQGSQADIAELTWVPPSRDPSSPEEDPRQQPMRLIAKANGRSVTVPVASITPSSTTPCSTEPSTWTLRVDLDLGHLLSGRPAASLGCVVRLELWRGLRVLDAVRVACLRDAACVADLGGLQRQLAAAGQLDPEDEAYLSDAQQRLEAQQLLGDLGAWLDFAAAVEAEEAAEGKEEDGDDSCDLSGQLRGLLSHPDARTTLLGGGKHLLRYFVYYGCVALAGAVHADLAPLLPLAAEAASEGVALADGVTRVGVIEDGAGGMGEADATTAAVAVLPVAAEEDEEAELTLLHRAVRSGSRAMVELVLGWLEEGGGDGKSIVAAVDGAGGHMAASATSVWAACGATGVTPLHLLAADARCYGTCYSAAAATAAGTGAVLHANGTAAAEAGAGAEGGADAEALLWWVIRTYPEAVTVWNTARDVAGNTPAVMWAALGGQDVQPMAAAAALAAVAGAEVQGVAAGAEAEEAPHASPPVCSQSGPEGRHTEPGAPQHHHLVQRHPQPQQKQQQLKQQKQAQQQEQQQLSYRPSLGQLLRLTVLGFPRSSGDTGGRPSSPGSSGSSSRRGGDVDDEEARYVAYVTATMAPSTAIWVVLMVVAHAAAYCKSLSTGDTRQAVIGGAAYVVSLLLLLLQPRTYTAWREPLMLSCLLGRTTCRLLMSAAPAYFHMSGAVVKYVLTGLDLLLDGFMEGAFEQVRFKYVAVARLVEWPIMAAFFVVNGVRQTFGQALLRSAAVSVTGLAMSVVMDMQLRAAFLRRERRQQAQPHKVQTQQQQEHGKVEEGVMEGMAGTVGAASGAGLREKKCKGE